MIIFEDLENGNKAIFDNEEEFKNFFNEYTKWYMEVIADCPPQENIDYSLTHAYKGCTVNPLFWEWLEPYEWLEEDDDDE